MKKIRLILAIFLLVSGTVSSAAKDGKPVIKGFSGGMMIHTGWQFGEGAPSPYNLNINSVTFGLGGCAKIHFTEHFRSGFEGYFSTAPVRKGVESGSHNKVFWTGVLADWFWKCEKFTPYIGATVGGGMETAFYMFEGDKYDWTPEGLALLHKQAFFAFDPYVGVEYRVGRALRLTVKADWLTAINSDGLNRPFGPRIYFGVIFAH